MEENKRKILIICVIFLVIILMFISFLYFGRINDYKPTGNVDIFDINVDCDCDNKCDNKKNDIPVISNKSNSNKNTIKEDDMELNKVYVTDKNGNYVYQNKLGIFSNPAYEMKEIVAPGDSNVYHFVIHNSTKNNIKYNLSMIEKSEYKINMKYRLLLNNKYIIGDKNNWVSASELKLSSLQLPKSDSNNYTLEWKWFDSDNDNIVGKNMTSLYSLNIKIYFEEENNA